MLNLFLGLGVVVIGFMISTHSDWILRNFGRVEWAEVHLSTEGGSRLFYILLGFAIIIFGLLIISGLIQDIMNFIARLFIR
ncbi:hypothetical protein J7J60_00950 [bacterium]|nr:hypothetical protein [bacterium]